MCLGILALFSGILLAACAGEEPLSTSTGPSHVPSLRAADDSTTTDLEDAVRVYTQPKILVDALHVSGWVKASALNRLGKVLPYTPIWRSLDSTVATVSRTGEFLSIRNGTGMLVAEMGGLADTALLMIRQVAVAVTPPADSIVLTHLGAERTVPVPAFDRNGHLLAQTLVKHVPDSAGVVALPGNGVVRAIATGRAVVRSFVGHLSASTVVVVRQIPATIDPEASLLTLPAGTVHTLQAVVRDSGGTPIIGAPVTWQSSDTLTAVVAGNRLTARLPGPVRVSATSGGASSAVQLDVTGIGVSVGGVLASQAGAFAPGAIPVLSNGLLRLRVSYLKDQEAGVIAEVRDGDLWIPLTSANYGDYAYVGTSVVTGSSIVEVAHWSDTLVAVRLVYGQHTMPDASGTTAWAYPFSKTLWLRTGDRGYFTLINLLQPPQELRDMEHETGFGGLWGAATIRLGNQLTIRTDTLTASTRIHKEGTTVDAAEFLLDGSPLTRVLVPLPGNELITPVFGSIWGSIYIHQMQSRDYGAYIYGAPQNLAVPARDLCRHAWENAPFALPAVTAAELAACGPVP